MDEQCQTSRAPAVDMDAHVVEPWDLWERYGDIPSGRGSPRMVQDSWGIKRLMVESQLFPQPEGRGRSPRRQLTPEHQEQYRRHLRGGDDADVRLEFMDACGIEIALLMPSQGLVIGAVRDPLLAVKMSRGYNDWLAEHCVANPKRLLGAAMIPLQSPADAVREIERAHRQHGFRAAFVRPNPVLGRNLLDPVYFPIFETLQGLDMPLAIHEGCGFSPGATVAIDRFENGLFSHAISHPFEQMLASLSLIAGGVLERFPKLRVAFMEAGCGWVPYWLDRLDHHAKAFSWEAPALTMPPSAYFNRQCVVTCDPDEIGVASVASQIGSDRIVFMSDYPHLDYLSDDPVGDFLKLPGLSEQAQRAILRTNAEWFLNLHCRKTV